MPTQRPLRSRKVQYAAVCFPTLGLPTRGLTTALGSSPLVGHPLPFFAHLYLAEAYAGLGQIDKTKAQAKEMLKIKPNFSLESEKLLAAYKDPVYKEHHFALLRKVGLK